MAAPADAQHSCSKHRAAVAYPQCASGPRKPQDYFALFDGAEATMADGRIACFKLEFCKSLDSYVELKHNQNQLCWKLTKVRPLVLPNGAADSSGDACLQMRDVAGTAEVNAHVRRWCLT